MNLYNQILGQSASFFGDIAKADQFLSRQCRMHLNREPNDLSANDLWNLANWVMISGSMFIGKECAEELSDQIRNLRKSMNVIL